jgi:hypothetical protein
MHQRVIFQSTFGLMRPQSSLHQQLKPNITPSLVDCDCFSPSVYFPKIFTLWWPNPSPGRTQELLYAVAMQNYNANVTLAIEIAFIRDSLRRPHSLQKYFTFLQVCCDSLEHTERPEDTFMWFWQIMKFALCIVLSTNPLFHPRFMTFVS